MQRVIGWLMAFVVMGYAQVYYELVPGWQLLGINNASVNMNDFNKSTVKAVWGYDKTAQKWKLYSPDEAVMQQASTMQSISALHQLNDKMGFWVLASETTSVLVNTQSNNIPLANCYASVPKQVPTASFQLVDYNVQYDDRVESANPVKWYAVDNVSYDETYYMSITASSENPSSYGTLYIQAYDDTGVAVGSKYSVSPGDTIIMEHKPSIDGKLYYKIFGYSANLIYKYSFTTYPSITNGTTHDEVTYEPNDYRTLAYPVTFNKTYTSRVMQTEDPIDWYAVENVILDETYYMSITASSENPSSYGTLYIQAYDDTGVAVGSQYSVSPGNTIIMEHKATKSGKLYYKIFGYSANLIYKYSFTTYPSITNGTTHDEVTYEPNDYRTLAYPVTFNKTYTSRVMQTEDPIDWYAVENVILDETYYMSITASSENPSSYGTLYIQAYDDTGVAVGSQYSVSPGNTIIMEHKATKSGKLYYKIFGYSANLIYKYSFTTYPSITNGTTHDEVTYEPNDYRTLAYPVTFNKTYTSRVMQTEDPIDWYAVENVILDETYYMSITASSENPSSYGTLYIQAYDDTGVAVGVQYGLSPGHTKQLTHKVTRNGNLYYKIWGYSTGNIYKYTFVTTKP